MKKVSKKQLILLAVIAIVLVVAWWVGRNGSDNGGQSGTVAFETGAVETTQKAKTTEAETAVSSAETTEAENPTSENAGESEDDTDAPETTSETTAETQATEDPNAISVEYDGEYTDKEHVALYIHLYGELPSNYITKQEAEDLGWVSSKKNLAKVAPGKSIGGSRFGNNEGLLPKKSGRKYYECDIDYVSGARNAKRIVYSNDGLVYYTEDHYETFELLYE